MSLLERGRQLGYSAQQVRKIIQNQKEFVEREKRMQEVLECNSLEDIKIILLDWLDKGVIK